MFLVAGCNNPVDNVEVSSDWNSILTKLEKSESSINHYQSDE